MLFTKVGSGSESRAIRSALAKLTVLVPPGQPKILRQGSGQKGKTDLELDLAEEDLVLEVAEGEVLELACISEGGRPAGEITWRDEEGEQVNQDNITHKNTEPREKIITWMRFFDSNFFVKLFGQVLTDTDTSTHKLEDKSWRTISKIRLRLGFEDRNKAVFCQVANHISEAPMDATARLKMKYTPRVSLTAEEEQVVEKGNVNLVCQVDSYPPAYMFAW